MASDRPPSPSPRLPVILGGLAPFGAAGLVCGVCLALAMPLAWAAATLLGVPDNLVIALEAIAVAASVGVGIQVLRRSRTVERELSRSSASG